MSRATTASGARSVHRLKITLRGSRPPIWRRVAVPSSATLEELHHIIQVAMGWEDSHLHEFTIAGKRYGPRGWMDDGWLEPPKDEARAKLYQVGPARAKFTYWYDFGDDWFHDITVEKIEKLPSGAPGTDRPLCLSGRGACPPEDCGGVWGYEHLLEVLADPNHDEYEDFREWVAEDFEADHFDLDEVNRRFAFSTRVPLLGVT